MEKRSKNESGPDAITSDTAIFIALGSNDKGAFASIIALLEAALSRFPAYGMTVLRRSGWWQSQAWPDPEDPPFTNAVVQVHAEREPEDLMKALSEIETLFGRARSERNAPRTLDLDLIAYGNRVMTQPDLIVPHPRAAERLFVMGPLAEIAPSWIHPVSRRTALCLAKRAQVGLDARQVVAD